MNHVCGLADIRIDGVFQPVEKIELAAVKGATHLVRPGPAAAGASSDWARLDLCGPTRRPKPSSTPTQVQLRVCVCLSRLLLLLLCILARFPARRFSFTPESCCVQTRLLSLNPGSRAEHQHSPGAFLHLFWCFSHCRIFQGFFYFILF